MKKERLVNWQKDICIEEIYWNVDRKLDVWDYEKYNKKQTLKLDDYNSYEQWYIYRHLAQ